MQITSKKVCTSFPNTEPWEDFLDISRWRVPANNGVIPRRLVDNVALYSGNYLWIWFVLASTWGLYMNWKVLVSFFIVAASWLCIVEFHNGRLGNSKKLEKDSSPSVMWLLPLAVFIFYALSVLLPILLTGLGTLLIAAGHATARPLVNESLFIHQQAKIREQKTAKVESIVHPDGFVDREEEQEEVTFVQPKSVFADQKCGISKPTRRAL